MNTFGFNLVSVMQITWQTCAAIVGCVSSVAAGQTPAPQFVQLSAGPILQEKAHRLVIADARHGKLLTLTVPTELRRALMSSSSIAFPAAQATVIDGQEFVLVVVNRSSSDNPNGYCGAGEEGTLYVLRLNGNRAEQAYSTLVQSCLKNIDLFTDSGNKSPYFAITWTEDGSGFQIHWLNYTRPAPLTRKYHYKSGTFVADQ